MDAHVVVVALLAQKRQPVVPAHAVYVPGAHKEQPLALAHALYVPAGHSRVQS